MGGKERVAAALMVGILALGGCKARDIGEQTPLPGINAPKTEQPRETSLKEKVLSFTWKDAENPDKLKAFVKNLADEYLQLTQTPRLKKEDLIGKGKTTFYYDRESYINAVREVYPQFAPRQTDWGATHYASKMVFIDFDTLKKQAIAQNAPAGFALIDTVWHEWGHLDVTARTTGEFINNPKFYFPSPNSNTNELFRKYRGGAIYSDTYYDFLKFEEVLIESITIRRIAELMEIDSKLVSAGNYYENGVDFFPKFTSAYIPPGTLYQMHATSDFEGLAELVGQNLPGNETPAAKGLKLFIGINQSNANLIKETGVFERIPR